MVSFSLVFCLQSFPPTAAAAANANALAGWMANAAASSSVQAAVVTASSLPVPQNQGLSSLRVLIEQKKLNIYFDDFFFLCCTSKLGIKVIH